MAIIKILSFLLLAVFFLSFFFARNHFCECEKNSQGLSQIFRHYSFSQITISQIFQKVFFLRIDPKFAKINHLKVLSQSANAWSMATLARHSYLQQNCYCCGSKIILIPVLVHPSANLAMTKRTELYIDPVLSKFVIRLNNSVIKKGLGSTNLENFISFSIILEITVVDIVVVQIYIQISNIRDRCQNSL